MPRVWILPQRPDPESEAIERLLTEVGEPVAQSWDDPIVWQVRGGGVVYAIERNDWPYWSEGSEVDCAAVVVRIDHHAPGDPGYGRPPAEFLPASSIGQVISELARLGKLHQWQRLPWMIPAEAGAYIPARTAPGADDPDWWVYADPNRIARVPQGLVLAAAADHCLGAAYRGECPGVDPDELMRWRAESRAAHQGRSVEDILADIEITTAALQAADNVVLRERLGHCGPGPHIAVRDMRRDPPYPELPDAAARAGVGYIAGPVVDPSGASKIVCSGYAEQVEAFVAAWAPEQGLERIYGDSARGFAGGYLP
jgi:hypothetical protein